MKAKNPDAITQAYYAGMISGKGKIVIYGECAERGTYHQFANLVMSNVPFQESIQAVRTVTQFSNTALKSKGKTTKKRLFYLTRREQEIVPLAISLGFIDTFNQEWDRITTLDEENGMKGMWAKVQKLNLTRLPDWESVTHTSTINLQDLDATILQATSDRLCNQEHNHSQNFQNLILNAFLEGQHGLTLGSTDLQDLLDGKPITAKYGMVAA